MRRREELKRLSLKIGSICGKIEMAQHQCNDPSASHYLSNAKSEAIKALMAIDNALAEARGEPS